MTPPPEEYRAILLTQNQVALVDLNEYAKFSTHKWYALKVRGKFYAVRKSKQVEGKRTTILMHREVLGLKYGDPRQGDHIETEETLNNCRSNLRIATDIENRWNTLKRCTNHSGFKGVSYDKRANKWRARITVRGKEIWLGYFDTKEEAHEAYKAAAIEHFGEFARF